MSLRFPRSFVAALIAAAGLLAAHAVSAQTAPAPRLEAQRLANAQFETFRTRCGKGYVVAADVTPPPRGGFTATLGTPAPGASSGHTLYVAYADVRLDGREITTDIDRRNGIAWRGTLAYSAAALRQISVGHDGTRGAWSPWQPAGPIYTVTLELKNGSWSSRGQEMSLLGALGRYAKLRRPACAEIPAG
ncbi:MAG: hypothetical protein C0458_18730 [Methylobacterium sp.]|nr:hypothetical protein [Methylobacterium sp.]